MIDKIEMYKVGFGDCFICSDNEGKNKMLVDCGSIGTISQNIIQEIDWSLSKSHNYLMITHFHDDHYNGLTRLNKGLKFDEIYLPNFFTRKIITLQFIALANKKNMINSNVADESYNIALNLLMSIPMLARHFINGTRVIFLNKLYGIHNSYNHRNGLDSLRILWPDMSYVEQHASILLETIMPVLSDESNMLLDGYVNNYIEVIGRSYDNGILYFHPGSREALDSILSSIEQCQRNLNVILSQEELSEFSEFQNKLCLCFDNIYGNIDNPVLFLSDIRKSCYKQLITVNDLADYYSTIKVPHHGTKLCYIGNLPNSDSLLIPNDSCRKNWEIYDDYFTAYCSRRIYPNKRCCNINCNKKCNKTNSCFGDRDYYCTHIL